MAPLEKRGGQQTDPDVSVTPLIAISADQPFGAWGWELILGLRWWLSDQPLPRWM